MLPLTPLHRKTNLERSKSDLSEGPDAPSASARAIHNLERSKSDPSVCAFTLTDLVAVVAAVSVVLLVAVPAIARARDVGSRAVCWNNLKQLGMAVRMYATDQRDYLPYPNWGDRIKGWLFTPPAMLLIPTTSAYQSGLLFQYTRDPGIYMCPVDMGSKYYRMRNNKLSSYVMNGAACGFGTSQRTCKISEVWSPQVFLMWHPDENAGNPPMGPFAFNDASAWPTPEEGVGRLHSTQGGEVLTLSGEVRFVTVKEFVSAQTSSNRGLLWWSPFTGNGR